MQSHSGRAHKHVEKQRENEARARLSLPLLQMLAQRGITSMATSLKDH